MDRVSPATPGTFTGISEESSPVRLLKRGLEYFRQGRYIEGASLCMLAREELSPHQEHFAPVIDSILASHARYWQAQEAFHQASRHFVEAETEQQTLLLTAERLLTASREEPDPTPPHTPARPPASLQAPQPIPSPPIAHVQSNGAHIQPAPANGALPALYISCFGRFEVRRLGQTITLCHRRNGQAILRYLVAQVGYRASVDRLMDVLWTQDAPEIARRKLQIAISALRCSLNSGYLCDPGEGYILCKDGFYQFNPSVTIRTDVDEFLFLWQAGRQSSGSESAAHYESACNLCSGPFLVEDMYADWSSTRREQLKQIYFTMCRSLAGYYLEIRHYEDAVKWVSAILSEDRCDEAAHRQLIQIYVAQGRRSEALQQYSRCERILSKELGVPPAPETMNMLQTILNSTELPLREKLSG